MRPPGRRRSPVETQSAEENPKGKTGQHGRTSRSRGSEDFQNILDSSGIATLVLDRDLKLRFFTPPAAALFKVTAAELGCPLSEIARCFTDADLLLDAQTVITTHVSLWREVEAENGAWFNRRLLPYRTRDDDVQGVIITFADISEMKEVEREIEAARAYANSIIDTIRQSLVVLDHELRIVSASPSFYRGFAILPMERGGAAAARISATAVSTFRRCAASSTGSPPGTTWPRITRSRSSCRRSGGACSS